MATVTTPADDLAILSSGPVQALLEQVADSVRVFATAIPVALIISPNVTNKAYVMPLAVLILGFMTVIYAITKINYSYEIPLFLIATLRGALGDHHKHHISNGLYLLPVLQAIDMPYTIIDRPEDLPLISKAYHHTRTFSRPAVALLTRDLLRGSH